MKELPINSDKNPKSTDSEKAIERLMLFLNELGNNLFQEKREQIKEGFEQASRENLSYEQIGVLVQEFQRRVDVLVRAESSFDSKVAIPVLNILLEWLEDLEELYIEQVEPEDTSQDEAPQLSPEEYEQIISKLCDQLSTIEWFKTPGRLREWYLLHGFDMRTASAFARNKFTPNAMLKMNDEEIRSGIQIGVVRLGIWKKFKNDLISGEKTILPSPEEIVNKVHNTSSFALDSDPYAI